MGRRKILVTAGVAALVASSLLTWQRSVAPVARSSHVFDDGFRLFQRLPTSVVTDATAVAANSRPCRPHARAVAHRAGARRVSSSSVPPGPYPCLYRTGFLTFEPTLAVPARGTVLVRGDLPASTGGLFPGVLRSTDGGRTWRDVSPLRRRQAVGDPYLTLDAPTGRIFSADLQENSCTQLSFTNDRGESWTIAPQACGLSDHETVFAGPPATTHPVGYADVVYLCANAAGASVVSMATGCLRSLDGGVSFAPTGALPYPRREGCDGASGHGVVSRNGTIYLPRGWCGEPYLAISDDEGDSWTRVRVAPGHMPKDDPPTGQLNLCGNGACWSHESAVAVDRRGNLYYAWISDDSLPYLTTSRDGGRTWTPRMMIGPPGLFAARLPGIDVGRPGRIAIAYMGRQGFASDTYWNGYVTITANALAPNPLFYTATVNPLGDPLVKGSCGAIRCGNAGDFFDVVVGPEGNAWAAFADTCTRRCATNRTEGDNSPAQEGWGVIGRLRGGPNLRG